MNHGSTKVSDPAESRVEAIHRDALIFDALTTSVIDAGYVDVLREAGVDATNYTVAAVSVEDDKLVQDDFVRASRSISRWLRVLVSLEESVGLVRSVREMEQLRSQGRFAVFFGFQNASPIEDDLDYLDLFY